MGRLSRVRNRWLTSLGLRLWRLFATDLDLSEAKKQRFESLHDCFVRELKDGARQIDPRQDTVVSPCDAIVGAHGKVCDGEVIQAKGFPYPLSDLLPNEQLVEKHRSGTFVTLRIKSSMYHRFHAPCDSRLEDVTYISGDTWNVNPIALRRVEKLFCKNERAVLDLKLDDPDQSLTLVPVAAILVAGIRLHALDEVMDLRYCGPNHLPCSASYSRGDEMGYFQHGSTILVFASGGFEICDSVREGERIRVGEPLLEGLRPSYNANGTVQE